MVRRTNIFQFGNHRGDVDPDFLNYIDEFPKLTKSYFGDAVRDS